MDDTGTAERFLARLAAEAGTPALDDTETRDVLDLARVVAHTVERKLAPLTAYALGVSLDPTLPARERAARVRAITETVRRLAHDPDG